MCVNLWDLLKLNRMFFSLVTFVFVAVRSKRSTIRVSRWRLRPTGWRGPCVVPLAAHLLFFVVWAAASSHFRRTLMWMCMWMDRLREKVPIYYYNIRQDSFFFFLSLAAAVHRARRVFFVSTGGNLVLFFYFSFLFSGCFIFYFCLGVFFV